MSEGGPRILADLLAVELHSRECICRGTGWLSAPGIGQKAFECSAHGRVTVQLPVRDWVRLGRPKNIEEYEIAEGENG